MLLGSLLLLPLPDKGLAVVFTVGETVNGVNVALGWGGVGEEDTAVEVKLAEGDRRMNPEVIRVTETVLADPSKVRLILKLPDTIHLSLENFLGKVGVESLDDSIDLLSLEGGKLGDGNAFERNDSVVLSGTTEVSFVKGRPPVLGDTVSKVHTLTELSQLPVLLAKVPHQSESSDFFLTEKSETGMRTNVD